MANQKIHEYPLERFVYGDDDYYDIDYWDGSTYQTAKILGSTIKAAMLSGIAISLTAPDAFIVGGSPVDGTGTLTLTAAGLANQYIRGDGTLATFPATSGGGNNVNYYLNGGTPVTGVAGYYQMSKTAVIGLGVDFSLAGNGLISQWLTDIGDPNILEIPAGAWNFEIFFSASSAGGTPAFYIEVLKYDGTTFTSIADNSAAPESITSGTATDLYLSSVPMPLTTLLATDRIALRVYIVNSVLGRTITQHTQDSHLNQVITTFSSGISSINGLTKQTQYLAVGTTGTDFNIDSTTDTHTFNLPTASATNRGALKKADWSTFNGKQNAITLTTLGSGAATFIADTLNIPTASGGTPAGLTGQIQFNNGGAFGADSGLFWDNTNKRLGVGATPASTVRLDVRAQGALSTDIAFRVRNSADTANLLNLQSDGVMQIGQAFTDFITLKTSFFNNAPSYISIKKYANDFTYLGTDKSWSYGFLGLGHTTPVYYIDAIGGNRYENAARIGTNYNPFATAGQETSTSFLFTTGKQGGTWGGDPAVKLTAYTYLSTVDRSTFIIGMNKGGVNIQRAAITSQSNLLLQAPSEDINDIGVIYLPNGTAPTSSITDGVKQYSADIVAGNAAPHFRTENGSVIKLYKQDLPTNPTNAQIATFLSNLGFANLI